MKRMILALLVGVTVVVTATVEAQAPNTLRGSRASMLEQNGVARQHDFTFLATPADVRRFVEAGYLVRLNGNANYALATVEFPYVRSEVRLFVERLSTQYRSACGEKLVVTSATRPRNRQPGNASTLSVHPTGMAVDLRVSQKASCRRWLESLLLALDGAGVLNVTREYRPPHYHVAVYPKPYTQYVQRITRGEHIVSMPTPTNTCRCTRIISPRAVSRNIYHRVREHGPDSSSSPDGSISSGAFVF